MIPFISCVSAAQTRAVSLSVGGLRALSCGSHSRSREHCNAFAASPRLNESFEPSNKTANILSRFLRCHAPTFSHILSMGIWRLKAGFYEFIYPGTSFHTFFFLNTDFIRINRIFTADGKLKECRICIVRDVLIISQRFPLCLFNVFCFFYLQNIWNITVLHNTALQTKRYVKINSVNVQ